MKLPFKPLSFLNNKRRQGSALATSSASALPQSTAAKKYLAIVLDEHVVQTALWTRVGAQVVTLQTSGLEGFSDADAMVVQVDRALQSLGKESEGVNDAVFGLESSWVSQSGVVDERKPLLKKLTEKLSLNPVGFLDLAEARLAHFAQAEPLFSAVLVIVGSSQVQVQLLFHGQQVSLERVGRSADLAADVNEALARMHAVLGTHKLPPRMFIVLRDPVAQTAAMQLQQKLIGFDWLASQPFLHAPTVELLPAGFELQLVVEQGSAALFGASSVEATAQPLSPPVPVVADDLDAGFTQVQTAAEEKRDSAAETPRKNKQRAWFQPFLRAEHWAESHLLFASIGFFAGLLILLGVGWWFTATKAQIRVVVARQAEVVSEEAVITLDPEASQPNMAELILPAELIDKTADGQKSIPTTGVSLVGEEATGSITIRNKTNEEITLAEGTEVSSGDFSFALDSAATIPAATVEEQGNSQTTNFGTKEVEVTALQIGAESNLSAETSLTVSGFEDDELDAEVVEGLTGGASREVRVAAEEDIVRLRTDLVQELSAKIEQQLADESGNGRYLLAAGKAEVATSQADAEVGDEVNAVTLNVTVSMPVIVYSTKDLQPLVEEILGDKVPAGYLLVNEPPQILSSPLEREVGQPVQIKANISARTLPDLDTAQLIQQLAGQSLENGQALLEKQTGIKSVTIQVKPSILQRLVASFPAESSRISLEYQEE